jgi:hypothetical protein
LQYQRHSVRTQRWVTAACSLGRRRRQAAIRRHTGRRRKDTEEPTRRTTATTATTTHGVTREDIPDLVGGKARDLGHARQAAVRTKGGEDEPIECRVQLQRAVVALGARAEADTHGLQRWWREWRGGLQLRGARRD